MSPLAITLTHSNYEAVKKDHFSSISKNGIINHNLFASYTVVVRGHMLLTYQGSALNDRCHGNAMGMNNSVV